MRSPTSVAPRGTGAETSAVGGPELDALVLAVRPANRRLEPDARNRRARPEPETVAEPRADDRRGRGQVGCVKVGAAQRAKKRRLEAEHGNPRHAGEPRDVRGGADDRLGVDVTAERAQPRGRRHLAHRHKPREVLAQHEIGAQREGGLVAASLLERRAVRRREEAKPDADREERDRGRRCAGPPRDGERAQPCHEQPLRQRTLEQPDDHGQQPRRRNPDDRDERDRERQQHDAGPAAPQELVRVRGATGERCRDRDDEADRDEIERAEPTRARAGRERDDHGSERGERKQGPGDGAARLEQGVAPERPLPERSGAAHRNDPRERDPGDRERERLRRDDEAPLPQRHAEQRQPSVRRLRGSPQPCGCERGEREQQRSALTAEQQQPARADRGAVARRGELLRRRDDVEADRCRLELRTRARRVGHEPAHAPRVDVAAVQLGDPAVAPVGVREVGQRRGGAHTLGEQERRRGGLVVPDAPLQPRREARAVELVAVRRHRVAEERRRAEHAAADDDEAPRRRTAAAQLQDLAARSRAPARESAARQADVRPENVDGAERHVAPADAALAEEHSRCRPPADRGAHAGVERAVRVALAWHAEPRRADRAGRRRQLVDGSRERTLLRDERADEYRREQEAGRRDTRDDEHAPRSVRAHAVQPVSDRAGDTPHPTESRLLKPSSCRHRFHAGAHRATTSRRPHPARSASCSSSSTRRTTRPAASCCRLPTDCARGSPRTAWQSGAPARPGSAARTTFATRSAISS